MYEELQLGGDRLDHFLLGIRLTYQPVASTTELNTLVNGARALFGIHHQHDSVEAAAFLKLWPQVVMRQEKEEVDHVWPLLGALQALVPEAESSSSTGPFTPPAQPSYVPRSKALQLTLPKPLVLFPTSDWASDDEDKAYRTFEGQGRSLTLLSDFSSSCRLITPAHHGGRSVLLIDMGGKSISVLPDGRVLLEAGWGRAKVYDLTGEANRSRRPTFDLDSPRSVDKARQRFAV